MFVTELNKMSLYLHYCKVTFFKAIRLSSVGSSLHLYAHGSFKVGNEDQDEEAVEIPNVALAVSH